MLTLLLACPGCTAQTALPEQDRLLSLEVTTAADDDYDAAFVLARSVGMQVTSLSLQWDDLEPSPGRYGTDPDWLGIANDFFPAQGTTVSLMIGPIDTNTLRLPADLKNKAFDDPEVIARFERLLDYVFAQIPDLELSSLAIGNEIDGYLGMNRQRWRQYDHFFEKVSTYARNKRPGLVVGSKLGFGGLTGEARALSSPLLRASDAVMLTYYPLRDDFTAKDPAVVHEDFDRLAALFPDKPLYILEAGYPSSSLLGSSEAAQAAFVHELFSAWDEHAEQVKVVSLLWLHDLPPGIVDELVDYYGLHDEKFRAYLATLGLRTFKGEDKQAFEKLQQETQQRGW